MPTAVPVSIEEYLHTVYEPDAEYVDGMIEERVGFEYDHSRWQGALLAWFYPIETGWNVRAMLSLRMRVSPTRFRVPDVMVLDRSLPVEQIITVPPLAVIEILSPEDRFLAVMRKLGDYERMGIGTILIVDQTTREFYRYVRGSLLLLREDSMQIAGSAAKVDRRGVEALLD